DQRLGEGLAPEAVEDEGEDAEVQQARKEGRRLALVAEKELENRVILLGQLVIGHEDAVPPGRRSRRLGRAVAGGELLLFMMAAAILGLGRLRDAAHRRPLSRGKLGARGKLRVRTAGRAAWHGGVARHAEARRELARVDPLDLDRRLRLPRRARRG